MDRINALEYGTPRTANYNCVLCNYYPNGDLYIGAHSDSIDRTFPDAYVCGLSLGSVRRFDLIPKFKKESPKVSVNLQPGSLLIMGENCQTRYKHTIPKTRASASKKIHTGRVNLTFRERSEGSR